MAWNVAIFTFTIIIALVVLLYFICYRIGVLDIKDIDEVCLTFGKYRGMTPCDVSIIDPHYIVWMYHTVKPVPCSLELMLACQEEAENIELAMYYEAEQYDIENYGDRD
jgi:hypothetical protein